jgi:SecD/SecF fusion protein
MLSKRIFWLSIALLMALGTYLVSTTWGEGANTEKGIEVTLEVSVPELVKKYVRNPNNSKFQRIYTESIDKYRIEKKDFIGIFRAKYEAENKDDMLVRLFDIAEIEELNRSSTNQAVEDFLRAEEYSSLDIMAEVMRRRIINFGIAPPTIRKDQVKGRMYVAIPGVRDKATIANKMAATADLEFFEIYSAQEIQYAWQEAVVLSMSDPIVEDAIDIDIADEDTTVVEEISSLNDLTSLSSEESLASYVLPYGPYNIGYVLPENKADVDVLLAREDILNVFPETVRFMWSRDMQVINPDAKQLGYLLYAIRVPDNGRARVGGVDIKSASTGYDTEAGKITVDLEMTADGGDKWARMTEDNVNKQVAISMDNRVFSAPNVENAITGGLTQISGSFTNDEAKDLAAVLNAGALPVPFVIIDQIETDVPVGNGSPLLGIIILSVTLIGMFLYLFFFNRKTSGFEGSF